MGRRGGPEGERSTIVPIPLTLRVTLGEVASATAHFWTAHTLTGNIESPQTGYRPPLSLTWALRCRAHGQVHTQTQTADTEYDTLKGTHTHTHR